MKWLSALLVGALLGFVLPTMVDAGTGLWRDSWAGVWTVRPDAGSADLLFSIPVFLISAIGLRMIFNWHTR